MEANVNNIAYNNKSENRDHNVFVEEYFGGADTYIYIGGKLYDNISAIQFTLREQQKPIYGYGSRIYDDISTGTRIVQGIIKVPVKNTGAVDEIKNETPTVMQLSMPTYNAPNWVYKYTPTVEEKASSDSETNYIDENAYKVARVQEELKRQGYDVEVNGGLDGRTKLGIINYKRDNHLLINSDLDLELENRLNIHGNETVYHTLGSVPLRYEPSPRSLSAFTLPSLTRVVKQGEVGKDWLLIQVEDGNKGYVRRTEVTR